MVTVREAEHDMVRALEAGADDYVTKPVRFGELVARMHAVLRRVRFEAGMEPPVLQAGNLEMDMERHSLRKAGAIVHLTPTEFDLLALLMRNRGMPVTHAKLLRTIWGWNTAPNWITCAYEVPSARKLKMTRQVQNTFSPNPG